jgi:hypothetical protein
MKPKVIFKLDKDKDLWNNWDTINYESPWEKSMSKSIPVLTEMCKGKEFDACKKDLEKFLSDFYKSPLIDITTDAFQKAWNSISDQYFKRLEKIMKTSIPAKTITAYLTSQMRCPYSDKEYWFMVSFFSGIPQALATAGHEIMHLYFHNSDYWHESEKQIGKDKTADLKEALTVLLNLEFRDLWQARDRGKDNEQQQKLRNYIAEQWKKKKDFDVLMKKCMNYLKKEDSR